MSRLVHRKFLPTLFFIQNNIRIVFLHESGTFDVRFRRHDDLKECLHISFKSDSCRISWNEIWHKNQDLGYWGLQFPVYFWSIFIDESVHECSSKLNNWVQISRLPQSLNPSIAIDECIGEYLWDLWMMGICVDSNQWYWFFFYKSKLWFIRIYGWPMVCISASDINPHKSQP